LNDFQCIPLKNDIKIPYFFAKKTASRAALISAT
jgi:hypothetical protein